jgi:hypothetical protein
MEAGRPGRPSWPLLQNENAAEDRDGQIGRENPPPICNSEHAERPVSLIWIKVAVRVVAESRPKPS